MNLDSLLSTILNNLNLQPSTDITVKGTLSLVDFMGEEISLNKGQLLSINFDSTNSMLSISSNNSNKISLPLSSLTLDNKNILQNNTPIVIEAKIATVQNNAASLNLISINKQPVQQYLRQQQSSNASTTIQPTIIKTTTDLSNISLQYASIDKIIKPQIDTQLLPEEIKSALQDSLQQIKIKVGLENLSFIPRETEQSSQQQLQHLTSPITTKIQDSITSTITETIKNISLNPQQTPEIINVTVKNISNILREFVGAQIPANTITLPNNEVAFETILGNIKPEQALQLPNNLEASIKILDVINTKQPISEKEVSPQEKILQILEPLKHDNPKIFAMISSKLPSTNENMLSNMVSFVKATTKGDINHWLGNEIVQELESNGNAGKSILNDLQQVLQGSSRNTPLWRIVEIPFYVENHINKIKLAIKQYPEEDEDNTENRDKYGTRFVVDTDFSMLGSFQFDGFSFAKDRRFDLIIRTERDIGNDIYANIIKIFKTTLHEVKYVGNININLKENFIKISEDDNEDKFTSQDLYV